MTDYMYEDELPEDMSQEDYDTWFEKSSVDFVRIGPVFYRKTLATAGNILDNAPIAEGERYVYDPTTNKMLKIFVSQQTVRN